MRQCYVFTTSERITFISAAAESTTMIENQIFFILHLCMKQRISRTNVFFAGTCAIKWTITILVENIVRTRENTGWSPYVECSFPIFENAVAFHRFRHLILSLMGKSGPKRFLITLRFFVNWISFCIAWLRGTRFIIGNNFFGHLLPLNLIVAAILFDP
jgi:hypothetical protein